MITHVINNVFIGWGRGAGARIDYLRHIDVPLINATTCQDQLRKTILGPKYVLDRESFICAGGEKGSDACAGDGGSPLMCEVAGKLYITGMVKYVLISN